MAAAGCDPTSFPSALRDGARTSSLRRLISGCSAAHLGRLLCLAGAIFGGLGLIGWIADVGFLTTFMPGRPPMMPNTALSLLLVGIGGALRRREHAGGAALTLSVLASTFVLGIGLGTLAEYVLSVDLGLDQLFLSTPHGPYPGRPSPLTASALSLLAAAILFLDARPGARVRPSEWLAVSAWLIAFTALLGLVFGAGPLYHIARAPVIDVALPTALGLLLTAVGLLLERPHAGLMRIATSPAPGGVQLRRLWLLAVLAPMVLGLAVTWILPSIGLEELPLVFASLAALMTAASLFLLTVSAVPLNRAYQALESSRARTLDLIEQASDGIFVADLAGRYTEVNSAGCRMLGYSRRELLGKTIFDLLPPEDVEPLLRSKEQLLEGHVHVAEWKLLRKDGSYLPVEVSAKILSDGRWQGLVRDIGERKRVEERLRQSEERLDLALRGADLGSWDWNIVTGEVVISPRWAEMRGFCSDEIAPHVSSWIAGVHPDDWPRIEKALDDCFQGQTPDYESEHRALTKTGEWIWVLDRGRVFARDEQGRPTRMVGTELEITERKRAEAALQLAEAKSSGILATSADAIISIDEAQRITLFNEAAQKIFGYSRAEALGAPLDLLVPERFRASHRRHLQEFADSPRVSRHMGERSGDIYGLRKNGQEFPVDAAISKLEVGGTRLLTIALRDVTEQKRLDSEQRFLAEIGSALASTLDYEDTLLCVAQVAVNGLADVCIVDIAAEAGELPCRKVVCRDPAKARLCEVLMQSPLDASRRHPAWASIEPDPAVLVHGPSSEVFDSLARTEEQLAALRAIASKSMILAPLVARGKLLGGIVLVAESPAREYGAADVRLAEELARRAALSIDNARLYELARRAVQARDDVLGIVAHDLRNPLGTILMQAALLRRPGGEPEQLRKPADVIERAVNRMSRLIQDLLDVTQLEAGRLFVEGAPVATAQVVADAVEAQRGLSSRASIELELELGEDLPDVRADRDRLLQILENLIGNAVKFTAADGRIVVAAERRDSEVLFSVADSGVGIASGDLPHVFDRFWQARKSRGRGAGLGLPIVKGIVEAHGGRVWVESAPGRGSTFYFTIPAAPR